MHGLKYIDLERFRFLTGHGKEFALEVDAALAVGDAETGGLVSQYFDAASNPKGGIISHWKSGVLEVHFMPGYAAPYPAKYIAFDSDRFEGARAQGALRYGEDGKFPENVFGLLLVLWRGAQRTITFLPAFSVMQKRGKIWATPYQVYSHGFVTDRDGKAIVGPNQYIGVTKRGWRQRWQEHLHSAKTGSHYKFHEAIRQHAESQTITHDVIGCYETEAEAMAAEEKMVGYETLYPLGLNMIPGGYAGMRWLHRIGAVGRGERVSPDDKHEFVNRFFEAASRKGNPNPLAAFNWQNDDYAERVICGGPDRLKPPQIREARYLNTLGLSAEQIATEVSARNTQQVERLLAGATYSRVA